MAKYLKRYNARLALQNLRESNAWIAKRYMLLETDEGDLEIKKGEEVVMGATADGDLAIKDPTAVVVVSDEALASKIIDAMVNAKDLSDVEFLDKPALDAALDGTTVDDIIAGLIDGEEDGETVEEPVVKADDEDKDVAEKCESISKNVISAKSMLKCERAYFAEDEDEAMNLNQIQEPACEKEPVDNYNDFSAKVAEMGGSVQPGEKEIALDAEGKVVGYFEKNADDPEMGNGVIFKCACDTVDDMMAMEAKDECRSVVHEDDDMADADLSAIEESLKTYEESTRSAKDLFAMAESLEKAGLKESTIGKVANTFASRRGLTEGVNVFDTKLGKVVAVFGERVSADNYIAESGDEARFTKRFFG